MASSLSNLKRLGDQGISRNSTYGIIPVPNFNDHQGNVYNSTVDVVRGHAHPVAYLQHVIRGKLHSGYKTKNRVFEDQQ